MNLLAFSFLFFSFLANAQVTFDKLPTSITCESEGTSRYVKTFELYSLNTDRPRISIPDAPLVVTTLVNNFIVDLGFSNFCENDYGLVLFVNDLIDLKSGKLNSIQGILRYNDTALRSSLDTDEDVSETISIFCRLN